MKKKKEKKYYFVLKEKEVNEIYNALSCLNIAIRDKQKKRVKFVRKIIERFNKRVEKIMKEKKK